jgi:hypothetical protein
MATRRVTAVTLTHSWGVRASSQRFLFSSTNRCHCKSAQRNFRTRSLYYFPTCSWQKNAWHPYNMTCYTIPLHYDEKAAPSRHTLTERLICIVNSLICSFIIAVRLKLQPCYFFTLRYLGRPRCYARNDISGSYPAPGTYVCLSHFSCIDKVCICNSSEKSRSLS